MEVVAAETGAWADGGGDDDPVEVLLAEETVERVPVGAPAADSGVDVNSLCGGLLLDGLE